VRPAQWNITIIVVSPAGSRASCSSVSNKRAQTWWPVSRGVVLNNFDFQSRRRLPYDNNFSNDTTGPARDARNRAPAAPQLARSALPRPRVRLSDLPAMRLSGLSPCSPRPAAPRLSARRALPPCARATELDAHERSCLRNTRRFHAQFTVRRMSTVKYPLIREIQVRPADRDTTPSATYANRLHGR